MKINIFSLKGLEYGGEITSLNAKTEAGEITVLDGHRPIITILKKGDLVMKEKSGSEKKVPANSGFIEVDDDNTVSVLIN